MKEGREVALRLACTRHVRHRLRVLLLESVLSQLEQLRWEQESLESELEDHLVSAKYKQNQIRIRKLDSLIFSSICQCAMGGLCKNSPLDVSRWAPEDLDMVYSLIDRKWYCIDCYSWIREHKEAWVKGRLPDHIGYGNEGM